MSENSDLPEDILFHCRQCNASRPGDAGELHRCVSDDARWPRCCGVRMAVSFPHGHPELVIGAHGGKL